MKSKVAIIKCTSYDEDKVYNAVKKGIDLLGGIEKLIPVSDKVILKPNLLLGKAPEKAVTTHPSIFNAIIEILKEKEYAKITYGDSPGFEKPTKVSRKAGLVEVAKKHDIELADFETGDPIVFDEGRHTQKFDIATGVMEADALISLPKMKTHMLCKITGAIKNQLGCVYGLHKSAFHVKYPNAYVFSKMLIDLNLYLKPKLYILDGIVAMEGEGPSGGDPIPMNCILISTDPIALDTMFCKLIDVDPSVVPTNVYGERYGLGTMSEIEVIGDDYEELINKDFKAKREAINREDSGLMQFSQNIFNRPTIVEDKCVKCGICEQVCPLQKKAVTFANGRDDFPIYDYTLCIKCYCCQEMCPQAAIEIEKPFWQRMFRK